MSKAKVTFRELQSRVHFLSLRTLTLRRLPLRIQPSCCEKNRSYGEAIYQHFCQQPQLSSLLTKCSIHQHVCEPPEHPTQTSLQSTAPASNQLGFQLKLKRHQMRTTQRSLINSQNHEKQK